MKLISADNHMVKFTSLEYMEMVWIFDGSRCQSSQITNDILFDIVYVKTRANMYELVAEDVCRILKLVR